MFQSVTELLLTFGKCSSSFRVCRIRVCSSSLLFRNIRNTFVAWDVLTIRRIIESHETGCVWFQD
jgi:hypothetical protein